MQKISLPVIPKSGKTSGSQIPYLYFFSNASLVRPNVNTSDSFGTLSTNGFTIHPSPVGISLDNDTASHWIYTPPFFSSMCQYEFSLHMNPLSLPIGFGCSPTYPGFSISWIRLLIDLLTIRVGLSGS